MTTTTTPAVPRTTLPTITQPSSVGSDGGAVHSDGGGGTITVAAAAPRPDPGSDDRLPSRNRGRVVVDIPRASCTVVTT